MRLIQKGLHWSILWGLALLLVVSLWLLTAQPAQATLREFEAAQGQLLVQSRQTLSDQHGNRWQVIAFKRTKPDGTTLIALRLVGFPGSVEIDRTHPLTLMDSLGNHWQAADASAPVFTDQDAPEPHIGQYDLQPIVNALRPELPLEIWLPTHSGEPVRLQIPPQGIQEWRQVGAA